MREYCNRWIFHNIYYWYRYNHHPTYWKTVLHRFLKRKTICRWCWKYPFACKHIDPEVMEMINKAYREGRIPRRTLPPRD